MSGSYLHEEENEGKLYSRDVLRLLFSYVLPYRKYMVWALFFVFCIAGANLAVPYLFKFVIDRFVVNRGRVLYLDRMEQLDESPGMLARRARRGKELSGDRIFLYQSDLKFFSGSEIDQLTAEGVLSTSSFILVQPDGAGPEVRRTLQQLQEEGQVRPAGSSEYLLNTNALGGFTVSQLFELRSSDFRNLVNYILLIFGILAAQFGASYMQIMLLMKLSQQAMRNLRTDLFAHTTSLEVSFYDRNPVGRLVNRVTNDVEKLNELFSSVLVTLFQDVLMLAGITAVMYLTSYRMALLFSVSFPFLAVLTILFRVQVRKAYRLIRTRISELNSFLNETISGVRIVQIFVREAANLARFREHNQAVYRSRLKHLYVIAVFRPLIGFMRWFTLAVIIYFSARGIVQNWASFGILVMFIAYTERFFHPIQDLSEKFDILQSANAAGEKILGLMRAPAVRETGEVRLEPAAGGAAAGSRPVGGDGDGASVTGGARPGRGGRRAALAGAGAGGVPVQPEMEDARVQAGGGKVRSGTGVRTVRPGQGTDAGDRGAGGRIVRAGVGGNGGGSRFKGGIRFEDVWFSYTPGEWVLRGVSFEVQPNRTLAIVGETGAGKTTIINILARFYPVQRGSVLIDGADISEIPYERVRGNIGIVMQDIFLFSRSIRENIVLGNGHDSARFEQAVGASNLSRFIEMLPHGEDEQVMERGVTFSAGERQLLSFARALYADPSILVLDEATSSIDTETEMLVQDAISRLTQGRTSIIIAHRLSTIRNADRIIVLERGKIAETGTHRELMRKKGLYHRFYSLQFGALR